MTAAPTVRRGRWVVLSTAAALWLVMVVALGAIGTAPVDRGWQLWIGVLAVAFAAGLWPRSEAQ